jgi:transposase
MQGVIPPVKFRGRKRKADMREVLNGIFYVLSTGCNWNALPKDLPRTSTVLGYFHRWSRDGTLERIYRKLYV